MESAQDRARSALVLSQAIFAVWNLIADGLAGSFTPLRFCCYRTTLTTVVLFPVWLYSTSGQLPAAADVPRVLLVGTLGVFGTFITFLIGLSMTSGATASLYMPLIPVLTASLSILLGHEEYIPGQATALGLAAAGALCVVLGSAKPAADAAAAAGHAEQMAGHAVLLCSALCQSFYLLFSRPVVQKYQPVAVTSWLFAIAAAEFNLACAAVEGSAFELLQLTALAPRAAACLAFAVVCATCVNYNIVFFANSVLPSSSVSLFSCLQPMLTCGLALVAFGKTIGLLQLGGGALIIDGLRRTIAISATAAKARKRRHSIDAVGGQGAPLQVPSDSTSISIPRVPSSSSLLPTGISLLTSPARAWRKKAAEEQAAAAGAAEERGALAHGPTARELEAKGEYAGELGAPAGAGLARAPKPGAMRGGGVPVVQAVRGVPVDSTGDGVADAMGFDTTGDGLVDAVDTTGDGRANMIVGPSAAMVGTAMYLHTRDHARDRCQYLQNGVPV